MKRTAESIYKKYADSLRSRVVVESVSNDVKLYAIISENGKYLNPPVASPLFPAASNVTDKPVFACATEEAAETLLKTLTDINPAKDKFPVKASVKEITYGEWKEAVDELKENSTRGYVDEAIDAMIAYFEGELGGK